MHFANIGKKPPIFAEATFIAQEILSAGYDYESSEIVFNKFRYDLQLFIFLLGMFFFPTCRNVISYRTENQALVPYTSLSHSGKYSMFSETLAHWLNCLHKIEH